MSYTKEIQKRIDKSRQLLTDLDEINDFQFKHYEQQKEILAILVDNCEEIRELLEKRKIAIDNNGPLITL